jgi:hypothetical protein
MSGEHEIHRLGAQLVALPPHLEALVAYWLQKCAGRPMPARDELPERELRPWFGNLALIETGEDERSRIRLCGTNLIRRFGREATGVFVADLAFDIAGQLRAIIKAMGKSPVPVVSISRVRLGHGLSTYSEVALPLSGRPGTSTVLLGSYSIRES